MLSPHNGFAGCFTSAPTRVFIIQHRFTVISGRGSRSSGYCADVDIDRFRNPERAERIIDLLREIEWDAGEYEAVEWIIAAAADKVRERRLKEKPGLIVVD